MKEIKIHGLTQEHVDMLDMMWSLADTNEFTEWMDSLDNEGLQMAMTLKELLLLELIDEESKTITINKVKKYLTKFRLAK